MIHKTDGETDEDYEKLPDKQEITREVFAISNLGWVLQTDILPVLREQQMGNKSINQNTGEDFPTSGSGMQTRMVREQNHGDR
jgi:hypothetical protein